MSASYETCVHCGHRVPANTRAIHERACIQQIRAADMAARQRQRAAATPLATHSLGAPPTFKIPAALPQPHAQDNRNRTGPERSHDSGVPPAGSQDIRITGFPHPSAAPMNAFLHTFPVQPTSHQAAPPVQQQTARSQAPAAHASAAHAPAAHASAAHTPAAHAPAAHGGAASHATASAAAGVPSGSGASAAEDPATPSADPHATPGPSVEVRNGDFETVFHPHARREPVSARLDFSQAVPLYDITQVNYEPWRPFATRTDYELAEFMLTSGLSRPQATMLFDILNRIVVDPKQLTVKSYDDVQKAWDAGASKQPAFHAKNFTIEYEHENRTYTFQHRDAWDWAESLVTDPLMCRHFVWHSYKQYKGINGEWVQFIDEPYTAERLYEFESTLLSDGVALPFVIYADKTRLSSFGTQKAYPIIARLANLPSSIRNSSGHGGGQIVGFLPIVEDEKQKRKPAFAAHKREVWHDALRLVLKKVIEYSRRGKKVLCGDGIRRRFFPLILMCVADYEEQAMMTLIRGVNGLFPCPVCLVPAAEQAQLGLTPLYPLRTEEQAKEIVLSPTLTDRQKEDMLKKISIRDIPNVFWDVNWSDPHKTNSFDRLHAYHTGLFAAHLLTQYQDIILEDSPAVEYVHDQVNAIPPWADLYHATDVATFKFSDGSKYEALSKVIVPATYNVLLSIDPRGLPILRAMRVYSVLDMYASLELHTEEHLKFAEKYLPRFSAATKAYNVEHPKKSFNFPKGHTQQHTTADIRAKGVTKNYNTKPSERAHGVVKDIYAERTNFKNVEAQISKIEHQFVVAKFTRYQLDFLDELLAPPVAPKEDVDDLRKFHQVHIGSHDDNITLASLQHEHAPRGTFDDLPERLLEFIRALRNPSDRMPHIDGQTKVTTYKYMKIRYESVETWKVEVDKLRITPDWYSKPRYDWVLFRGTALKYHFGQLQSVFTYTFDGVVYPLALVTVYDFVFAPRSRVDHELGLVRIRLCQDQYAGSQLIHLGSIIRGALVIDDHGLPHEYQYKGTAEEEKEWRRLKRQYGITKASMDAFFKRCEVKDRAIPPFNDRLVIDLVDPDMFLRLREYFNLDT